MTKRRRRLRPIEASQACWELGEGLEVPASTEGIEPQEVIIGQDRAIKALRMGLELYKPGYNVFVCGITGSGRTSTVRRMLDRLSPSCALADDFCYVNNFEEPERPRLVRLPRGQGTKFRDAVGEMMKLLRREIESLVNSEAVKRRVKELEADFLRRAGDSTHRFQKTLEEEKLALARTSADEAAFPEIVYVHEDQPIDIERIDFMVAEGLIDAKEADRVRRAHQRLQPELQDFISVQQKMRGELIRERSEVERRAVGLAITSLKNLLLARFSSEAIEKWLAQVERTILDNLDVFKQAERSGGGGEEGEGGSSEELDLSAFGVNVVLTGTTESCPVVVENNPSWSNLFGSQDRVVVGPGVYGTDFSRIKPGSLLRAQGGYLILTAADLLTDPSTWQQLKRVLRTGELVIQPPDNAPPGAPILTPDPIPLNVKTILLGSTRLYDALCEHETDFPNIFKIKADFDSAVDLSPKVLASYVQVIVRILREEQLRDLDAGAIEGVLQFSMREAGRRGRLSTRFSLIADILREADYHAKREESKLILAAHVRTAVHDMSERLNLTEEKLQRRIKDGDQLIEVEGSRVGQVNGLTVLTVGEHSFGLPARISCRVGAGRKGLIDIEREAEMTGSIYEKGTLVLQGFLIGRFAVDHPLTFAASMCFEQSYLPIDGDSASSTELFVLLSAIAELPLRQDLAITGSVDQFGTIQPIGGVNEKIEGFFDACVGRGLTGSQGAIIPRSNVADLMLAPRVVEAIRERCFFIHPIETIDEGIEILTGVAAGRKDAAGEWTAGSVNDRVQKSLLRLWHVSNREKESQG